MKLAFHYFFVSISLLCEAIRDQFPLYLQVQQQVVIHLCLTCLAEQKNSCCSPDRTHPSPPTAQSLQHPTQTHRHTVLYFTESLSSTDKDISSG